MKQIKARYNKTSPADISEIEREMLQKEMLNKYGNQLVSTDEYARLQFITTRAQQLHPNFLSENPDVTRVVNAATLSTLLVNEQAKKGNLDARYLSSVLSLAGKYMPDNLRMPIIEKTFYEIDGMRIPENAKNVLKTGVGLGNIDYIGKIAKDPVLSKKYGSTVDNVLNLIYNNQERSSKSGNELALETGDKDKKTGKSYSKGSGSYAKNYPSWKDSFNKQNASLGEKTAGEQQAEAKASVQDNANAREQLSQKLAGLGVKFKRTSTIKMDHQPVSSYKKTPKNDIQKFYATVLQNELAKAQSEKLENSDKSDTLKGTNSPKSKKAAYKSKKWKTVALKVPKGVKLKTSKYKR